MMSIEMIGIGSIFGATIVMAVNIYLNHKVWKDNLAKEQLNNLYSPMNALIKDKYKILSFQKNLFKNNDKLWQVEYYQFFVELRHIYLSNEVYSSLNLRMAFHPILHNHAIDYSRIISSGKDFKKTIEELSFLELEHHKNNDGISELEKSIEKVIEVINDDIYTIYQRKTPHKYYKESMKELAIEKIFIRK